MARVCSLRVDNIRTRRQQGVVRREVFSSKRMKTAGGLGQNDLTKNRKGKVVSFKKSNAGLQNPWLQATMQARLVLQIKGFHLMIKGAPLYEMTKKLYENAVVAKQLFDEEPEKRWRRGVLQPMKFAWRGVTLSSSMERWRRVEQFNAAKASGAVFLCRL